MPDTTVSLGVLEAVQKTLATFMPAKVPSFQPKRIKWHLTDRYVLAGEAPTILITERGWNTVWETCRSIDSTGATVAGIVFRRMTVEIQVWQVAEDEDKLVNKLREWCDGISAVLDASPELGETKLASRTVSGATFQTLQGGSPSFGAGNIRAEVDVFIRQGEVAL